MDFTIYDEVDRFSVGQREKNERVLREHSKINVNIF